MPREYPIDQADESIKKVLKKTLVLHYMSEQQIKSFMSILTRYEYDMEELVYNEHDEADAAYIVEEGEFCQEKFGHRLRIFYPGDLFGDMCMIGKKRRTTTMRSRTPGRLLKVPVEAINNAKKLPLAVSRQFYRGLAEHNSMVAPDDETLYNEMDVLLIQDGGCAPGYNPVTAYISEYLEKANRQVFVAAEGFRSIVNNLNTDYRCLIYDKDRYQQLEHIRGVMFSPPLRAARGADFRSERYPEFREHDIQKRAAKNILDRKVRVVVGIGGDGTLKGIKALAHWLPDDIQLFFIPVTIDSDIWGTSCIGEFTGVEVGADKIRGYLADARTHNRCYIIEMMGARGGYHALHSCLGAGGHLAVLPNAELDLEKIANAINPRSETVIVVAEGYKENERKEKGFKGNAAEYFRDELVKSGLDTKQRVICEAFSRDIRGAQPNNMDITLAHRMARRIRLLILEGETCKMPAVRAGQEYDMSFEHIRTDNSVSSNLASLANRLF